MRLDRGAGSNMSQGQITKEPFGQTHDGTPVDRYTLHGPCDMRVSVITYGATVTDLWVPDRNGQLADVVLGFDRLLQYETHSTYFGCMVGRVAFRIARGQFELDGQSHQLTLNNGPHHLHGGTRGFNSVVWQAEPRPDAQSPAVKLTHRSPSGDQGYPGTLDTEVIYTLTAAGELRIDCRATTDRPTPVNLTQHSYFNLAGAGNGDVLDHVLQIDAGHWVPDGQPLVPSGKIASVKGTRFDFTAPLPIGARPDDPGGGSRGYDLAYLRESPAGPLLPIARLSEPKSGRQMEVLTTEPGIVLYTGNYLDGTLKGKGDAVYPRFGGVCLETGRLPDSVHHPNFPSTILRPDEIYRHVCVYRFSAAKTTSRVLAQIPSPVP